ncbi:MAG: hypothetical protein ACYCTL_00510 [Acidimicrobiales bacterium]
MPEDSSSKQLGDSGLGGGMSEGSLVGPLRAIVMSLLGLLGVQFVLGMYANLDVSFATGPSGASGMDGMRTVMDHPGLALHMGVGFALVVLGIVAVVLAARAGIHSALWLAAIGLAALVGAGIGGLTFVMDGQTSTSSYVMAIGFLVGFSCYFAELTVTR